eukprot:17372-Pelagococcus_subviridis.AAC.1
MPPSPHGGSVNRTSTLARSLAGRRARLNAPKSDRSVTHDNESFLPSFAAGSGSGSGSGSGRRSPPASAPRRVAASCPGASAPGDGKPTSDRSPVVVVVVVGVGGGSAPAPRPPKLGGASSTDAGASAKRAFARATRRAAVVSSSSAPPPSSSPSSSSSSSSSRSPSNFERAIESPRSARVLTAASLVASSASLIPVPARSGTRVRGAGGGSTARAILPAGRRVALGRAPELRRSESADLKVRSSHRLILSFDTSLKTAEVPFPARGRATATTQ